jgi:thymidylate kinase
MAFFICITGIDGAGKTTLSRKVAERLNPIMPDVRYVYNRYIPFLVRPLLFLGNYTFLRKKDIFENYAEYSQQKRIASKKHPVLASLYQTLVLCDYALQIFFKVTVPMLSGSTIVCDRYIYDTVITDFSVDFNYSDEEAVALIQKISRYFSRPDLVFLLDVPETVAYARKDDVPSIAYLKDRRKTYLHAADTCGMIRLDGTRQIEDLVCSIEETVRRMNPP